MPTLYSILDNQSAMVDELAQKAVSAALAGDWKTAISLNREILKNNRRDVDALNRLARAYSEVGEVKKAKSLSSKALKIDPFNTIAQKSLAKWKKVRGKRNMGVGKTSAVAFLEEPGKTKIVPLIYLGDSNLLAELDSGDSVVLAPHSHRVTITTHDGKYIGRLTDDLSARLRKLISLGNTYQAFIKSVSSESLLILIRETKRAQKILNVPSFPAEKIEYNAFTPPELVHKKEE